MADSWARLLISLNLYFLPSLVVEEVLEDVIGMNAFDKAAEDDH